jgi:hypothetical protein
VLALAAGAAGLATCYAAYFAFQAMPYLLPSMLDQLAMIVAVRRAGHLPRSATCWPPSRVITWPPAVVPGW